MIKLQKKLSTKFNFLVNKSAMFEIFRQSPCLLCDESSHRKLMICCDCLAELPWNKCCCYQCGLPITLASHSTTQVLMLRCGECISKPPPFTRSIMPFSYDFPVNSLIQNIKYRNQRYLSPALSKQLLSQIELGYREYSLPDYLIPIPLHKNKLKQRKYNQAALISRYLARQLSIPERLDILFKCQESPAQAKLNKQQRLKNLKSSFALRKGAQVKGKYIAIVDDVMTTRATAEVNAQLLINNGAKRVDVWCLARTPKLKDVLNT